jgi:hypothetical protein
VLLRLQCRRVGAAFECGVTELDRDGKRRTGINGKAIYSPLAEWRDRALADRFSAAVVAVLRTRQPDVQ